MRLCNICGINDMAQVGAGEALDARSALALATTITGSASLVMTALDVIGKARRSDPGSNTLEVAVVRAALHRGSREGARLTDPMALPESIENLVEALPIRMRRAE